MKSISTTGITRPVNQLVLQVIAALLSAVLAINATRFIESEIAKQEVQALTTSIQNRRSNNFDELDSSARALSMAEPFRGALAEIQADALSTIVYLSPERLGSDGLVSFYADIRKLYEKALQLKSRNGYLWARYAVFLDHAYGAAQRDGIFSALSHAIDSGPRDYNTIRLVARLGIKRWPWLNCEYRGRLVDILGYAETVDDQILARWNSDLRISRLQADLEQQYKHYGFNLQWARLHVNRCGAS